MSGWDEDFVSFLLYISPIFLVIWFFIASSAGIIYVSDNRRVGLNLRALFRFKKGGISKDFLLLFLGYTLWLLLPIILRGLSIRLEMIGVESLAEIIYS
jgi:hypothetical protein